MAVEGGKDMTTRVESLVAAARPVPVTWRTLAADFGQLLGRALALAVAVGLLLTAATVALPAPLVAQAPVEQPQALVEPARATSGCFLMRRGHDQAWTAAPALETQ